MPAFAAVRPQPQAAPLNEVGQRSLALLLQNDAASKRLQARQRKAAETLRAVAGNVNDRAYAARVRHGNKLRRLEVEGDEEPEEELDEYNKYQVQVDDATEKLELGIRGIIDDIEWLNSFPDVLKKVTVKSGAVAEETQRTQSTIPMTTQRSGSAADEGDEDEEITENNAEESSSTPLHPSDAPTKLLRDTLEKQTSAWNARSLTEKYAETNEYIGFYRTVHDSKFPGDEVAVPHHTMWFAAKEGRRTEPISDVGVENDEDADDDIAIDRVVIRIKCPFTLQPFKDPVTSKKCPHSFERTAFYQVLKATDKHLPFTPEQLEVLGRCKNRNERVRKEKEIGIAAVQCPECMKLLAEVDVARDPILERKVQRIEAEKQRERQADEDSEDEDEDAPRGTQRKPVGLGSSPLSRRASGRVGSIKAESGRSARSLQPIRTQTGTPEGATMLEVEEEEEEEEDDDDDDDDDDEEMEDA